MPVKKCQLFIHLSVLFGLTASNLAYAQNVCVGTFATKSLVSAQPNNQKRTEVDLSWAENRKWDQKKVSEFIQNLQIKDFVSTKSLSENYYKLAQGLGLSRDEATQLMNIFVSTGILGGEIHQRALINEKNPYYSDVGDLAITKKLPYVVTKESLQNKYRNVLSIKLESHWSEASYEHALEMMTQVSRLFELYPRASASGEKIRLLKAEANLVFKEEQIKELDRLHDLVMDPENRELLTYLYKATLDPMLFKFLDQKTFLKKYVKAETDYFSFISLISSVAGPAAASFMLDIGAVPAVMMGFAGVIYSFGQMENYNLPVMHPFLALTRAPKTVKNWLQGKGFEREMRRLLPSKKDQQKLLGNSSNKLLSTERSSYDLSNMYNDQTNALRAFNKKESIDLQLSGVSENAHKEASGARDELVFNIKLAKQTLDAQMVTLSEMVKKSAQLSSESMLNGVTREEVGFWTSIKNKLTGKKPHPEAAMSGKNKVETLIGHAAQQKEDMNYTLSVIRDQIGKIREIRGEVEQYMKDKDLIKNEDFDLLMTEFVQLDETAYNIYMNSKKELNSLQSQLMGHLIGN